MGVGIGRDSGGGLRTVVGTSEPNGYLGPGVRSAIQEGEEIAPGLGHAEQDVLDYMQQNGIAPIAVGAGRPDLSSVRNWDRWFRDYCCDEVEAMTNSDISLIDAELADLLFRVDDTARRRAVLASVRLALDVTSLRDDRLTDAESALAAGRYGDGVERANVLRLVEELDETAWNLQDLAEAGGVRQEEYLSAFARARAAAAVGYAFEMDSRLAATVSLYEAHHAIQDLSALRAVVGAAID